LFDVSPNSIFENKKILVTKELKNGAQTYIKHPFYSQLVKTSTAIPLGVLIVLFYNVLLSIAIFGM